MLWPADSSMLLRRAPQHHRRANRSALGSRSLQSTGPFPFCNIGGTAAYSAGVRSPFVFRPSPLLISAGRRQVTATRSSNARALRNCMVAATLDSLPASRCTFPACLPASPERRTARRRVSLAAHHNETGRQVPILCRFSPISASATTFAICLFWNLSPDLPTTDPCWVSADGL